MLVYNLETGKIIAEIPDDNNPYFVLKNHNDVKNNNIGTLVTEKPIRKISQYMIKDGELIKLTAEKSEEMKKYKRLLTEEEREEKRLLNQLKPSSEEVKKAENTIEILSLIQEVM